jgi:hypothetical protein
MWSKAPVALDRLNSVMMGSNPTPDMAVCPHISLLCSPVQVEALKWTDPPSMESYQNVKRDSLFQN